MASVATAAAVRYVCGLFNMSVFTCAMLLIQKHYESVCADADLSPHVFSKQKVLILIHHTQWDEGRPTLHVEVTVSLIALRVSDSSLPCSSSLSSSSFSSTSCSNAAAFSFSTGLFFFLLLYFWLLLLLLCLPCFFSTLPILPLLIFLFLLLFLPSFSPFCPSPSSSPLAPCSLAFSCSTAACFSSPFFLPHLLLLLFLSASAPHPVLPEPPSPPFPPPTPCPPPLPPPPHSPSSPPHFRSHHRISSASISPCPLLSCVTPTILYMSSSLHPHTSSFPPSWQLHHQPLLVPNIKLKHVTIIKKKHILTDEFYTHHWPPPSLYLDLGTTCFAARLSQIFLWKRDNP